MTGTKSFLGVIHASERAQELRLLRCKAARAVADRERFRRAGDDLYSAANDYISLVAKRVNEATLEQVRVARIRLYSAAGQWWSVTGHEE